MPIQSDADIIRALLNDHWSPYVPYPPSPKQLAFCALPHMEALGGGAAGGGKVLPEYGHVLTPNGFISNSNLYVGMQVNHPDQAYSEITHLHEWNEYPLWRVHFHDGSFSDVTSGHLWFAWKSGIGVKKQGKRVFGKKAGKVIDTATLEQWLIEAKTQMDAGKRPNWPCIPVCGPQEFQELRKYKSLLSPYLLGMWLGDGNWSNHPCSSVCLTSGDHGHMEIALSDESYTRNGKFGYRFVAESGLIWKKELTRLNLKGTKANTKFVPKEFLTANLQTRLSLLQGLMDTDGTVDDRGQCYFTSVSEQLTKDVVFLVQSLGGTATKSQKTPYYRGKSEESHLGQIAYTLYIKAPEGMNLFRLERKSARLASGKPSRMYRRVVSIEKKGTFRGRCISVSHPNGLYITDQFVVTHNSAVLLMDALRYTDVPGYAAIIFRRSLTDLKRNGGLLDMAMQWLSPYIGRDLVYEASTHMFKWFNGASLTFGYVGSYTAWEHYQGGNYQYIAWDELTQHSEQDYDEMFSRLRRNSCAIHGDFPQSGCSNCDLYSQLRSVPLRVRGACVDEGEVLTGSGWKDIRLVQKGEFVYSTNLDGKLELKQVENTYKSFYDGPLTRIRKKNLYMSITPDHKVLEVTRGQRKQYKLVPFDEHQGTSIKVARTPLDYDGMGCGLSLGELAFLGLYLAEGSVGKPKKGNYKVIITQCNQHKIAHIKKLLTNLGYNWCYSKNGDFQVTKKALWEKFSVFGKAHEKFVPREVLQKATKEELQILLDWMVFGDGHVRKNSITYVTCSGQLADDVMEIGLKLGYKVQYDHHTLPNDKHHDRYTVYLTDADHPATLVDKGLSRNDVREEHYRGNVYCLKVKDNANFVLRQRGKVWLSGNTNPGGRGHLWVKKRFKLYKSKNNNLINPVTKKPGIWLSGDDSKPFIPWFFVDNPGLDQETYDQTLRMIKDDQRKAQLLEGDWDWIANGVFRPDWFAARWEYRNGYYALLSPSTGIATHSYHEQSLRIFVIVDVACSVREGVGERSFKQTQGGQLPASWTVMGVFGTTPKNELLVLDIKRFQQEAPTIFDELRNICKKWKPMYVGLEVNGPGKPIAQQALQYGIPIKEVISFVDKPSNSAEAQIRCRGGKVFLPREDTTLWLNDFMGELTTWTGHPHEPDDQVDVLSNAIHEFTRLCGNPDRDTTIKSHARDLPFISKKHGKIFDYPSGIELMNLN